MIWQGRVNAEILILPSANYVNSISILKSQKMVKPVDCRQVVGNRVLAPARQLTSISKCRRMYGAGWKTKMISGTVIRVIKERGNKRMMTSIEAEWELADGNKVTSLRLCSVKAPAGDEEDRVTEGGDQAQDTGSDGNEAEKSDAVTPQERDLSTSVNTQPCDTGSTDEPVVICNDVEWIVSDVSMQMNGWRPNRSWRVIGPLDEIISEGHGPSDMTPYDYFQWMFPMGFLSTIVSYSNYELEKRNLKSTSLGEILKYFGVIVLMSRFEFSGRRSLWSSQSGTKYIPTPMLGHIMSRKRFEEMRQYVTYSKVRDETDRWGVISEFITAINDHRSSQVFPSDSICVDESMSRWYGLGGDWIDIGLPHYVAMDRKPENGCELKTASCGNSGIILRMDVVMSAEETRGKAFESETTHGAAVTLRLVEPWFYTHRLVCADSYFSSVETAEILFKHGLRFTGVVKNATKGYPLQHLSHLEVTGKGEHVSMVAKDRDGPDLMAVMWIDRDRRYFISTAGTTQPGTPIFRERYRSRNGRTWKEEIDIQIPQVCETYYATCSQVDRHNRCRQDDLMLEKKFEVKEWSARVNTSLLAICVVDAWKLYCGAMHNRGRMTPHQFYTQLAEGLIDNSMDAIGLRQRQSDAPDVEEMESGSGIGTHLTPTTRTRRTSNGRDSNAIYQGRCDICKGTKKSKFVCSTCKRLYRKDVFICHHQTGRDCFKKHVEMCHDLSYEGPFY